MRLAHEEEIREFNDRWEGTLQKLSETSHKVEEDLTAQHESELEILEEDIQAMGEPTIKFSAGLLDMKCKLGHLIR